MMDSDFEAFGREVTKGIAEGVDRAMGLSKEELDEAVRKWNESPNKLGNLVLTPKKTEFIVPVLRIEPGDVLVLKVDDDLSISASEYAVEQLRKVLDDAGHKNVPVVVMTKGMELSKFHMVPTRLYDADEPVVLDNSDQTHQWNRNMTLQKQIQDEIRSGFRCCNGGIRSLCSIHGDKKS